MIQTRLKKIELRFLTPPAKYIFLSTDNKTWTLMRRSTKLLLHWFGSLYKIPHNIETNFENIGEKMKENYFFNLETWSSKIFEKYSLPDIGIITWYATRVSYDNSYLKNFSSKATFQPHFSYKMNYGKRRWMFLGKSWQASEDLKIAQLEPKLVSKITGSLLSWKQLYLQ